MVMKIVLRSGTLLVLLAIGVLSLLPQDARPHISPFPGQVEHVAAYAVAALFLVAASPKSIGVFRIAVFLTAYGSLLEICQMWIPGRTARLTDVGADLLGALIGVSVGVAFIARILPQWARRSSKF
jgi:VanZ family protein